MKKRGQSIEEWGLIIVFIAVISIFILTTLGDKLKEINTNLSGSLNTANLMSACESTSGTWANGACTCPAGKVLQSNGQCL